MQKIDRDRLDENTGQIECGEEIGTVFLIDKETAITVKHCLLIEKPETYAKNAVLHFSVKDEEKTVNATVISEDNDSSEDLVVLRCEESIDVQPLYLFSAELDVFDELQMVGYGKSFGFEKRWIQLKNTNLLKKTNKNMILDTIDSAAMDYEGFSGSLIADYNNCIVGIANMQNTEKGKANSLLGISVKNRKKFFENNNIPVYDRAALLNAHCKATKAKAFQNGIDQNVYLKNKQLENDTNSRNIEENTNPLLNISHMEGCMPKEVTKKEEIPENQVMSKERHRAKEAFFYEGNKYISLGQCCEFYGINESSVRSRAWRKKCTWEEAVKYYIQKKETETPKMQFFYKGKRYKSVSACCAEYGVNASSVRNRAKTTECSIEESLDHFIKKARMETQPSVFIFRDKTYRSLEECCLEYGVNADSVSSRKYRLNCTMEESLEHFIENKDMIAERIQKFTFKGIEYRSLRACCQKYGIDDICVRQRARDKNCSLEESFTHFMTRKRKKMLSNPEFEYHGTVYPSLKVCCEKLGINKSSVISRSHRAGCSLQEAVEYYVSQQERRTLD